ncbi:MAG TPA: hypothetical protein VF723_16795 [Pyrinomonadaceae bacterium]|jgi:hypothetical protein
MNKCQSCGVLVPAEKAFCPNCSEPMTQEERPNRAHSFSSDMMATLSGDVPLPSTPPPLRQPLQPPPPVAANDQARTPPESRHAPSVTGYALPELAPETARTPPPGSSYKRLLALVGAALALLALFFVLLLATGRL